MKVGELRKLLGDFSDNLEISWGDPNFGGELGSDYSGPDLKDFVYENGKLLINIPQVDAVGN